MARAYQRAGGCKMGTKHGQQKAIDAVWLPSKALGSGPHLQVAQAQHPIASTGGGYEAHEPISGAAMPGRTSPRPQVSLVAPLEVPSCRRHQQTNFGISPHTMECQTRSA